MRGPVSPRNPRSMCTSAAALSAIAPPVNPSTVRACPILTSDKKSCTSPSGCGILLQTGSSPAVRKHGPRVEVEPLCIGVKRRTRRLFDRQSKLRSPCAVFHADRFGGSRVWHRLRGRGRSPTGETGPGGRRAGPHSVRGGMTPRILLCPNLSPST